MLERELEKRRLSGKKVALAGISAGLIVSSTTACAPVEIIENAFNRLIGNELELEGDMPYIPLEGETEPVKPLMGEPAWTEENVDIPGELVEETAVGEVIAEVDGLLALPESETDEEYELAGVPPYECETDPEWNETWDTEDFVLEGDVVFPSEEEETV